MVDKGKESREAEKAGSFPQTFLLLTSKIA